MNERGTCQFCQQAAPRRSTCQSCIDEIIERVVAGEATRKIAIDFGTTRNAIIGLFGRNKSPTQAHPGAPMKSVVARAWNKANRPPPVLAEKPSGLPPHELTGCLWIAHDVEPVFGKPAPGSDWSVCQRDKLAGSSYCEVHHAKCRRSVDEVNAAKKAKAQAGADKYYRQTPEQRAGR
jgi:hypothetical protein